MAYSPESVIEFYDEAFVEITPENKKEIVTHIAFHLLASLAPIT